PLSISTTTVAPTHISPLSLHDALPILKSLLDYHVSLLGKIEDGKFSTTIKVVVPVTSLCPCSKEISDRGAHNQRSHVTITVKPKDRKSTRLNSSHVKISYAVFCLKKKR